MADRENSERLRAPEIPKNGALAVPAGTDRMVTNHVLFLVTAGQRCGRVETLWRAVVEGGK